MSARDDRRPQSFAAVAGRLCLSAPSVVAVVVRTRGRLLQLLAWPLAPHKSIVEHRRLVTTLDLV